MIYQAYLERSLVALDGLVSEGSSSDSRVDKVEASSQAGSRITAGGSMTGFDASSLRQDFIVALFRLELVTASELVGMRRRSWSMF